MFVNHAVTTKLRKNVYIDVIAVSRRNGCANDVWKLVIRNGTRL